MVRDFSTVREKKMSLTNCGFVNFEEWALRRRIIHDIWETPSDGLGERFRRTIIQPIFGSYNGVGEKESRARRNGIFIIGEADNIDLRRQKRLHSGGDVQRISEQPTSVEESEPDVDIQPKKKQVRFVPEEIQRTKLQKRVTPL